MTSGKQSKAQRRTESQQRAAERRAAELRSKRLRLGAKVGGVGVVVAAVVLIIVLVTGGSSNPPAIHPTQKDVHIPGLVAIPSSLHMTAPPATTPGPEVAPIPTGPKLATLANVATGQNVDGIQCDTDQQTVTHVHTHLTIFVNGKEQIIPYGIGIPGFQALATPNGAFVETGSCFYWLHTHAEDGIIHVESPSKTATFTLGQFFDEWGIPLSKTQVGPDNGKLTIFFASPGEKAQLYKGNPRDLPLGHHYQIQIDVGTPVVSPVSMTNADWGEL